jgi:hypothetical protein
MNERRRPLRRSTGRRPCRSPGGRRERSVCVTGSLLERDGAAVLIAREVGKRGGAGGDAA